MKNKNKWYAAFASTAAGAFLYLLATFIKYTNQQASSNTSIFIEPTNYGFLLALLKVLITLVALISILFAWYLHNEEGEQ